MFKSRWLILSVAATASLAGVTGCADYASTPATAQPTPTTISATATPAALPADAVVVVSLFDVTSSAIRFQDEAKQVLANQLQTLLAPGHGGFQLVAGTITSNSFDAANSKLALRVAGLPLAPVQPPVSRRPSPPDLTSCQRNPFGRQQCEAKLAAEYTSELNTVLAEEARARNELAAASDAWQQVQHGRAAEVASAAAQLRDLPLTMDRNGTDLWGALLRAAETVSASSAPKKLVVIASDWEPSGHQQEGDLHFPAGTIVKAIFFDCVESRNCLDRKRSWTEQLLAAGAERVVWLDPAASRLQTEIFSEVIN